MHCVREMREKGVSENEMLSHSLILYRQNGMLCLVHIKTFCDAQCVGNVAFSPLVFNECSWIIQTVVFLQSAEWF